MMPIKKAWDHIRNAFPDDNKGSRIILTTRRLDVAACVGSSSHVHEMQFLNDNQNWDLLRTKVGGYALWPEELADLGRRISRNCRGLPLAIVAMAGLLKFNMKEEYWKLVASDTKSETAANYDHMFAILALSYTNLPPYLKACFLYFGLFKEDYEIPTDELVRLWTAEGLLRPRGSKEMEEVAEEYLEELVARSLVLVKKKRHGGRIKTCSLHDVLRDLSLRKSHEERFSQHFTQSSSWMNPWYSNNDLRRVSIDPGCSTDGLVHHVRVRSVRCSGFSNALPVSTIAHLRLTRVLSTMRITEYPQLSILYRMTNLRYVEIFLSSRGTRDNQPIYVDESISNLQNLETLIFSGSWESSNSTARALLLPSEIWKMPRLRHLISARKSILDKPISGISCSGLQTLTKVTNLDLDGSMIAILSNLKKLKLHYDNSTDHTQDRSLSLLGDLAYPHNRSLSRPGLSDLYYTQDRSLSGFDHDLDGTVEVIMSGDSVAVTEVRSPPRHLVHLHQLEELNRSHAYTEDRSRPLHLVHLHQLEELNVVCQDFVSKVTAFSFPNKLKKLSLERTTMPVENMSLIGLLPNLEVLKLKYRAIEGNAWEPIEGEFVQLKYLKMERLLLEEWRAESEHFPQLETLIIKNCADLKEVPAEIGEINTLQKLVLEECKAAEVSVEEIKEEQESLCNDSLQVIIIRKRR